MRNNAHVQVLKALDLGVEAIPFEVVGVDFDNGSEFLNGRVIGWAADRSIFFTRSRPYRKNDQATVESKNNHLVPKHAFHYRYDSPEELRVLNRLWPLVNDRMNFLTPTKKPIDWGTDRNGRRKRIYDAPATPFDRLLASDVLSRAQQVELTAYRDRLNPAELARRIPRTAATPDPARQGQDRADLPVHPPHRTARRPQGHPRQGRLTARSRAFPI